MLVQLSTTPRLMAPILSTMRTWPGVELPWLTVTSVTGDVPVASRNVRLLIGGATVNAKPVTLPFGVVTVMLGVPVAPGGMVNTACIDVRLVTLTCAAVIPPPFTVTWCDWKRNSFQ